MLPLPVREGVIIATFPTLREAIVAALALARTPLRVSALEARDIDGTPRRVVAAEGDEAVVKRILGDAGAHRARERRARFAGEADAAAQAAADAAAVAKSLDGDAWVERVAEPLRAHLPHVWYGEPPAFFPDAPLKRKFDANSTLNPGRFVGGI